MDKKIIFAEKPLNIPVMTQMILSRKKKTAESEKETISDKKIASLLGSVKK